MRGVLCALILLPLTAAAGTISTRDLPVGTIIAASDLAWDDSVAAGIADPQAAIGRQVRVTIYAGRPVVAGALRDPVLVSRNQIVRIVHEAGGLRIETEARALNEGAAGDMIQAMNLSSRSTIPAIVKADGTLISASSRAALK
ncbi:flagellar basal body P-ring formation chaperone FlgA [Paracoccus aerodenitrificans]|uniref:flagellar basal body P-ring formation chaperone FlgA n=1 Tax=Paracoccus aerodenitrificans TaxID=3017781 RepID=UPI0022F04B74|nr:flagellar basal body P-ring formation chaperone FlgA [Paracoccus aerodenitrificans]WBU63274.1 flagellar basal body P-ring formation chaperone FlgA [Paracoccus aerodenitrificans]